MFTTRLSVRIAAIVTASVLPLALSACNTLEGTGQAAMNITHGISEDARAAVNAVSSEKETNEAAEEQTTNDQTRASDDAMAKRTP